MAEESQLESISPYGVARSTVKGEPLSKEEIEKYNDFFKASLYLSLGMICKFHILIYQRNNTH